MVRDTSFEAYKTIYANGKAIHNRYKVFNCICENEFITRKQLVDKVNLPINIITPRVKELLEEGLIVECGKINNEYQLRSLK
jgi:ribosomal protein S25